MRAFHGRSGNVGATATTTAGGSEQLSAAMEVAYAGTRASPSAVAVMSLLVPALICLSSFPGRLTIAVARAPGGVALAVLCKRRDDGVRRAHRVVRRRGSAFTRLHTLGTNRFRSPDSWDRLALNGRQETPPVVLMAALSIRIFCCFLGVHLSMCKSAAASPPHYWR